VTDEVQLALLETGQAADAVAVAWEQRRAALLTGPGVAFRVLGLPQPKGSKTANAHGFGVRDANAARLRPWEGLVAAEADRQREVVGCLTGPLGIDLTFRFPGPTTAAKWLRALGAVPMSTMPDLDKLERAVWDGIQAGGLIENDARIACQTSAKFHVWDDWVGVRVVLRQLPAIRRVVA
jgi:Holliday junction resolvase RusA-like endonuclease